MATVASQLVSSLSHQLSLVDYQCDLLIALEVSTEAWLRLMLASNGFSGILFIALDSQHDEDNWNSLHFSYLA